MAEEYRLHNDNLKDTEIVETKFRELNVVNNSSIPIRIPTLFVNSEGYTIMNPIIINAGETDTVKVAQGNNATYVTYLKSDGDADCLNFTYSLPYQGTLYTNYAGAYLSTQYRYVLIVGGIKDTETLTISDKES